MKVHPATPPHDTSPMLLAPRAVDPTVCRIPPPEVASRFVWLDVTLLLWRENGHIPKWSRCPPPLLVSSAIREVISGPVWLNLARAIDIGGGHKGARGMASALVNPCIKGGVLSTSIPPKYSSRRLGYRDHFVGPIRGLIQSVMFFPQLMQTMVFTKEMGWLLFGRSFGPPGGGGWCSVIRALLGQLGGGG